MAVQARMFGDVEVPLRAAGRGGMGVLVVSWSDVLPCASEYV